jgi:hypothetical protein
MKRSITLPGKILAIIFTICSLFMLACAKNTCPTYMAPMERVKSLRGQEINGSWEGKSVPSPRPSKRKYMVKKDTLSAAGSRIVFHGLFYAYKGI